MEKLTLNENRMARNVAILTEWLDFDVLTWKEQNNQKLNKIIVNHSISRQEKKVLINLNTA